MASAPLFGPTVGLQVGPPPPPSSSVNTTVVASSLNVAECQNAKLGSVTESMTFGAVGSRMSRSTPWPMQAPAARPLAGYAVMSWQPLVAEVWPGMPGKPPSGNRTGVATTLAFSGCRSGTSMIEILSWGGWQSGKLALGPYDWT